MKKVVYFLIMISSFGLITCSLHGAKVGTIEDYDKAIERNPKYAPAYNNRGWAYFNLGDKRRAIEDFDKALELNPKLAIAFYNRGISYKKLGENQRAIEDFQSAARLGGRYGEFAQEYLTEKGIAW